MRGFYAVPLADDDGRVGTLSFESSDPDFLGPAHLEMIKILTSQATVALRNASLYREVPFIDLLKPVLDRKRKFLALEKRRRALLIAGAAAATVVPPDLPVAAARGGRRFGQSGAKRSYPTRGGRRSAAGKRSRGRGGSAGLSWPPFRTGSTVVNWPPLRPSTRRPSRR